MGLFQSITLRGQGASIVWGYRRAAALAAWRVDKRQNEVTHAWSWTLIARLTPEIDRFQLRQKPLLFTAPRKGGFGFWCWPVRSVVVGETKLHAELGPPEY